MKNLNLRPRSRGSEQTRDRDSPYKYSTYSPTRLSINTAKISLAFFKNDYTSSKWLIKPFKLYIDKMTSDLTE